MAGPRTQRFWLWFTAAWLLVLAFYFFAFYMRQQAGLLATTIAALFATLPDAVLGIGVVHVCRRIWRRAAAARRWQLAALALAFTLASTWSKVALSIWQVRLDGGRVDWASYDRSIVLWDVFFSLLAWAVLTSVTFGVGASVRLRHEEARRAHADLLRAQAELKALRAQLNPHFLFNTLHSVRALVRASPDAAEQALEQLGDLLRYALRIQDAADDRVLLGEEWEFVRAYLAIEQMRMGDRLRVVASASDAALACVVPAFVLQPLVENAIRHGVGRRPRGGTIWIDAQVAGGGLCVQVRDDGAGASDGTGDRSGDGATKGTGKGLELVRQRLHALPGATGSLVLASAAEGGLCVTVRLARAEDDR